MPVSSCGPGRSRSSAWPAWWQFPQSRDAAPTDLSTPVTHPFTRRNQMKQHHPSPVAAPRSAPRSRSPWVRARLLAPGADAAAKPKPRRAPSPAPSPWPAFCRLHAVRLRRHDQGQGDPGQEGRQAVAAQGHDVGHAQASPRCRSTTTHDALDPDHGSAGRRRSRARVTSRRRRQPRSRCRRSRARSATRRTPCRRRSRSSPSPCSAWT